MDTARMTSGWIPVASSEDVVARHVFQGKLWGQELAIWRADDGFVNVWENRCLHRGVRLSIGVNTGTELVCQYHGWRYANRNAGCTYIPAHPADAPARTICNRTYPVREALGMIWTHLGATDPEMPAGSATPGLVLRAMPVRATPEAVAAGLAGFATEGLTHRGNLAFADSANEMQLFVQPMDAGQSVIRGVFSGPLADQGLAFLRRVNTALAAFARATEIQARAAAPPPASIPPVYSRVSDALAEMPEMAAGPGKIRVTIASKTLVAEGICALDLRPLRGILPAFQPGAHIDVALPNGLVRQYSLVNSPGETDRYIIGVKRDPNSAGGSAAIHDQLRAGDLLAISEPHNNFTLRRDAEETIFLAGGIGVTPLLAMAAALASDDQRFRLHYFAAGPTHLAFGDRLAALGHRVTRHFGLDPAATGAVLSDILSRPGPARQVYVCGPGPMLDVTRMIAAQAGWPESAVHFEYFRNTREIDDSSSFEIALARSAMTLHVPAGKTILQVLRDNGVAVPSSCGQGACGTCKVRVLDGVPDHQDVYLSNAEKSANDSILTCVSRAKSNRLILDL